MFTLMAFATPVFRIVRRTDRSSFFRKHVSGQHPARRLTVMRQKGINFSEVRTIIAETKQRWTRAGPSEKLGMVAVGLLAGTAATSLITVLGHLSVMFTMFLMPIVFFPLAMVFAASIGTALIATMAVGGFGFVFFMSPLLAVGAVLKLIAPLVTLGFVVSIAKNKLFGIERPHDSGELGTEQSDKFGGNSRTTRGNVSLGEDPFYAFDERLRRRERVSRDNRYLGDWTVDDVVDELVSAGLGQYQAQFIAERIDGSVILSLTEGDIKSEFGSKMPLGDRIKLSKWILQLQRRQ